MINPFAGDGFTMAQLTAAINLLPNMFGKLQNMNLFPEKGVNTRTIMVEEMHGVLNLLSTKPVGAPGAQGRRGKRKLRSFVIPHIPLDTVVLASDVEGIRDFGTESGMMQLIQLVNNRMQEEKNKHAITLEYLRMGALKGLILDADGTTLYDLYSEFEITAKAVNFALTTAGTDVRAKCLEVKRHMELNLMGEFMTGVRCLCGPGFFDALTDHTNVKAAYANYTAAADMLGGDNRKGFKFGEITFEEYNGSAPFITETGVAVTRKFIEDDEAHFYPAGTTNTFATYAAPADFNETVNTIGKLFYSNIDPRKHNRGYDLHTQSNPLPMCLRPSVLVKGSKS